MSNIIRPREICRGPRCGFMVKIYTSFNELNIFAMANIPSLLIFKNYISSRILNINISVM